MVEQLGKLNLEYSLNYTNMICLRFVTLKSKWIFGRFSGLTMVELFKRKSPQNSFMTGV